MSQATAALASVAPANFFHDYHRGTVLFVGFLFAFWALAQRRILTPPVTKARPVA